MWIRNPIIVLAILTCTALSYKYPYKHCCRWKPIHGPLGIRPYPPKHINEYYHSQKIAPAYGAPSSIYKPPPNIQKPFPSYGSPQNTLNPVPIYGPPPNIQNHVPIYGPPQNILSPVPIYGPPEIILSPASTYGPPQNIQKPNQIYGVPSQNYIPNHGFNNFPNFQNHGNYQSQGYNQNLISPEPQSVFAHQKVIAASHEESKLPAELLNPFYKNPGIREVLGKHSWIGPGEKPVVFRETDRIPRHRIYEVLSHAGLIKRR